MYQSKALPKCYPEISVTPGHVIGWTNFSHMHVVVHGFLSTFSMLF